MRIAVVTPEFPPINAAASARIGPWVRELSKRGHEVKVFSSKGSQRMEGANHYASPFSVPSNRVGVFRRFFQEMRLACDLGLSIRKVAKKLDGVIITSPPFFMAAYIAKISKGKKIPYLFDIRDRYPKVLFDLKVIPETGFWGKQLIKREKSCYQNSCLLTSVTKGIDRQVSSFQRPHAHVSNGFDPHLFDHSKFKKKDNVFRIVYHGRFSRLHDISALRKISLRIKELNPEIEFLIIGPIPQSYKSLEWGNARFAGEKKRGEIPELLSSGSVGISLMKEMTSTQIAMPAKVYEYIGMALPLVVAPDGELNEFVKKNKLGIGFEKMNVLEIAKEIVALEQDRQKYSALQERVISIQAQFDRRSQSAVFADLVEKHFNFQDV